jgi:hypothetical protein
LELPAISSIAISTSTTAKSTAAASSTTTAAAATASTTTAKSTAAASTTSTTAASATLLAWARFIDGHCSSVHFLAVKPADGFVGFIRRHFNERKSFRTTGVSIGDDVDGFNRACLREEFRQILFGRLKRQIAYVNTFIHNDAPRTLERV